MEMWTGEDHLNFKKRFAWRVYRCFVANKHLKNYEKYKGLFEKAREITLERFRLASHDADDETLELMMYAYALSENEKYSDWLEINEDTASLLD